jgi:alkylation response protein AidB-like acyl-CoA dehydrogenase
MNEALKGERNALVDSVRRFAESEIAPHVTAWDEAGEFPRTLPSRCGVGNARGRLSGVARRHTCVGGAEEIMKELAARRLGW